MELKNILTQTNLLIFFLNIFGIFLLRLFLIKKKLLIDQTSKNQSTSKEKNIVLIGGLILIINLIYFEIYYLDKLFSNNFKYFILIFFLGLFSDLYSSFEAKYKFLILIIFSFIFLMFNNNFVINKISIFFVDNVLFNFFFIKVLFTSFCLTLYISGNNMVDGIDGNSIGHNILIFIFLLFLMNQQNTVHGLEYFFNVYILIILFFLFILNISKILFLGDNGSYLLGSITGLSTIYIIQELNLNPFLASIFLFYPCFEVLFAFISKKKIFKADRNHLHIKLFDKFSKLNRFLPLAIILSVNSFFMFISILNYANDDYLKIIQALYFISLSILYYGTIRPKN